MARLDCIGIIAALSLLASGADAARRSELYPLTDAARQVYARMLRGQIPRRTAASLERELRSAVFGADLDGGGVSARDVELARGLADASERTQRLNQYFRADFNRDGVLTLDEYRTMLRAHDVADAYSRLEQARAKGEPAKLELFEDSASPASASVGMFKEIDADGDGRLSLADVYGHDARRPFAIVRRVEAETFLRLDADGNGIVTLDEVDATSAAFLAEQAAAGVGPLVAKAGGSGEEADAWSSKRDDEVVRCDMPAAPAQARIIRLGTSEAKTLSSVTLAGQDHGTFLVRVRVEPGAEPLYVIATSYHPTIWAFEGATSRVIFVGSSFTRDGKAQWPAVGATGLKRRQVHVVPDACFSAYAETSPAAVQHSPAAELVRKKLGRSFDLAWGAFQPGGIALPSMTIFPVAPQVPAALASPASPAARAQWEKFAGYYPGGVATLRPSEVVAAGTVEAQAVLPYQAGLAQLLEQGVLREIRFRGSTGFAFTRAGRYPPELAGGHSVEFVLPEGVPEPEGDPAHSRVFRTGPDLVCLRGC